ncbi:hypothetical protein F4824DRAFT_251921 [Ustulina deusta]|nr:hypothetical protein F4823DRAFT_636638 [Ustulina deusta]KAI3333188.1 hypothetical protein F4824DRAFT_251921 [Ustulina deusta]
MMIPDTLFDQAVATAGYPHRTTHTSHLPLPTVTPDVPRIYHQHSTEVGHKTLWVVCIIMGVSSLIFYLMAMRAPVQKRLLHILTAFITTFAFFSYYAMATGSGISLHTTILKETRHHVATELVKRQVFWARYIDWSLTTPLLLVDLSIIAGLNGASILVLIFADVVMILTGLFAALARDEAQGWGWYAFACVAYLTVIYQLAYKGRHAVSTKDNKTKAFFSAISLFTLLLWTIYPIVWGIADGARMVNVDGEIIAYAVLDIFAKPVFGFWLLLTHDSMTRTSPSIGGFWSDGLSSEGTLRVGDGLGHVDD